MITFFVPGVPVPKGSAKAFVIKGTNRAVVTQTNRDKQKPWASMIGTMAYQAGCKPSAGAICLTMAFMFQRPKSHYGSGKNAQRVKDCVSLDHVTKPDLDKLVRCALDALTGVAYQDDSQVMNISTHKRYAESCGVRISIEGIEEREDAQK